MGNDPVSKPIRVMLHMARVDNNWAGKATLFDTQSEFKFKNIDQLIELLNATSKTIRDYGLQRLEGGDRAD